MNGIILPATLAFGIVATRSLASNQKRIPRPYELASVGVIYAGAGLVSELSPQLGTAVAWGYLVALILAPSSSDLLSLITGGVAKHGSPPGTQNPKGATA